MAETLEYVRHKDGAPKKLTPALLLELVGVLRGDRDDWKLRAERNAYQERAHGAEVRHHAE